MSDQPDARHAQFDRARTEMPVYHDRPSKTFVLTRYRDARALLADKRLLRDADKAEDGALVRTFKVDNPDRPDDRNLGIGWLDPPDHARVRGPIAAALNRRVARLRPAVETIVRDRLDRLTKRTGFDVLADFANPIPIETIGHVLGVETRDMPHFRAWSEAAMKAFKPDRTPAETEEMYAASNGFVHYIQDAMADRRTRPRDDLISDLVQAQGSGAEISDAEIWVNCQNLLGGGNLPTADLIGNGVFLLLRHPGELAKLRADPARIGSAVEEVLRFEPPTDGTQRIASEALTIHGCPIAARQVIAAMIPAANRDPDVFAEAHRFDISRTGPPHLSFGGGAHICIGAQLARLQAQIAIAMLFDRFPRLRLAGREKPRWRAVAFFHGLECLPVSTGEDL